MAASDINDLLNKVKNINDVLDQYAYIASVKSENEALFYAALQSHPADLLPVVYTPGVAEACKNWGKLSTKPQALVLSIDDAGSVEQKIKDYVGDREIDAVVVTDGGRILGLGARQLWTVLRSALAAQKACNSERTTCLAFMLLFHQATAGFAGARCNRIGHHIKLRGPGTSVSVQVTWVQTALASLLASRSCTAARAACHLTGCSRWCWMWAAQTRSCAMAERTSA